MLTDFNSYILTDFDLYILTYKSNDQTNSYNFLKIRTMVDKRLNVEISESLSNNKFGLICKKLGNFVFCRNLFVTLKLKSICKNVLLQVQFQLSLEC